MNILITGANGFIGRALCKRLLADGYQVRGAVRGQEKTEVGGLRSAVYAKLRRARDVGGLRAEVGNIGPETDWSEALDGIDGIVHLAARVHVMRESATDPLAVFRQVNVVGTERLARQAAEAGVERMVYISSVKVNGEGTDPQITQITRIREKGTGVSRLRTRRARALSRQEATPCQGGQEGELKEFFSEKDVPEPQDPYAVSKWEAEQVLRDVEADTGLEVVILRPPLVYGPNVRANFLRLLRWVNKGIPLPLGMVDNRRSLVSLDNLVDFLITCIEHSTAAGETFLVSDGEDLSTPALIRRIALSMNIPARLIPVPVCLLRLGGSLLGKKSAVDRLCRSLQVDISKAKSVLGWKPPLSVDEGLVKTADWCLNDETNF
ncbi:MAG: SDR family oxidoreductase [Desulfobacterales bacterium]|nr:SDR family oxidoreductase [Desulfobacterales bacterium]